MQLRMLARRVPSGSMTVLGDLGQATGLWAHDHWGEVLAHLPDVASSQTEELTLGYRVAASIMDLAATVLAEAAPGVRAPRSVRVEAEAPALVRARPGDLTTQVVAQATRLSSHSGSLAVIVPDSLLGPVLDMLESSPLSVGEAQRDGLDRPITVVAASGCKGLEFDAVVVVEPGAIAAQGTGGLRLLYVALTRAMRALVIVHEDPLPPVLERAVAGLRGGSGRPAGRSHAQQALTR